jgi:DNA repair exonuclease SbcCD ATPase subunit
MIHVVERWKKAVVVVITLLLLEPAVLCASVAEYYIKKEEVDFEYIDAVAIVKGDTLWDFAEKYYDDPFKWPIIKEKNRIPDVRKLRIGAVIYIPTEEAKKLIAKAEADIDKFAELEKELRDEIAKLKEELAAAKKGIVKEVKEVVREEERPMRSEEEVMELRHALEECKERCGELEHKMRDKEEAIEDLEDEMRAQRRRMERDMDEMADEHRAEIRRIREDKEERIRELERELERCQVEIRELEDVRDEAKGRVGRAEKRSKMMRRDRDRPVEKEMKKMEKEPYMPKDKCGSSRSKVAAAAIALVGSIVWIASR